MILEFSFRVNDRPYTITANVCPIKDSLGVPISDFLSLEIGEFSITDEDYGLAINGEAIGLDKNDVKELITDRASRLGII